MKQDEQLRAAFQALTEISIIAHLTDTAMAQRLPDGLSSAAFGVLNHFARLKLEGESPARLARAFQVTKGAMTYTLQQLEGLDYVRIDADPKDARAKIVRLTAKGARARDVALKQVTPGVLSLLESVDAKEFAAALPFLTKLRTALDLARD